MRTDAGLRWALRPCGALAASLLLLPLLAGCGGHSKKADAGASSAQGKVALLAAIGNSFGGTAATAVITLAAPPAQLGKALAAARPTAKPFSDSQLSALAGTTITYATASTNGKPLPSAGAGNSNSSLDVTTPKGAALGIRSLGTAGMLYTRVDTAAVDQLVGRTLSTTSLQRLATKPGLSFVGTLLEGNWVGLQNLKSLTDVLALGGATAPATGAGPGLVQQFLLNAAHDTTVEKTSSTAGITHYVVSGKSGTIAHDLAAVLLQIPGATLFQQRVTALAGLLPDRPVTLDAAVTNGRLSQLDLDLTQLGPKSTTGPVDLRIALSTTAAAITAPPGATKVDAGTILNDASALLNLGAVLGGSGA